MRYSRRSLIAVVLTVIAAVGGTTAWALDKVDPGMTYGWGADAHGRNALTIGEVRPGGLAWYQGAHPGDIIINVGGVMTLPGNDAVLEALVNSQPDKDFYAVAPADLPQVLANGGLGGAVELINFSWAPRRLTASGVALLAGFLVCLMGFLWRRWASPGPALSRILPSVIAASATPLFLVPAYLTLNPLIVILVGLLLRARRCLPQARWPLRSNRPSCVERYFSAHSHLRRRPRSSAALRLSRTWSAAHNPRLAGLSSRRRC